VLQVELPHLQDMFHCAVSSAVPDEWPDEWSVACDVLPVSGSQTFYTASARVYESKLVRSGGKAPILQVGFDMDFLASQASGYDIKIHPDYSRRGIGRRVTEHVLDFLGDLKFPDLSFSAIDMGAYYWGKFPCVYISGCQTLSNSCRNIHRYLDVLYGVGLVTPEFYRHSQLTPPKDLGRLVHKLDTKIFCHGESNQSIGHYFNQRAHAFCPQSLWATAQTLDSKVSHLKSPAFKMPIEAIRLSHLLLFQEPWSGHFKTPIKKHDRQDHTCHSISLA